jgi:hypothetical protein
MPIGYKHNGNDAFVLDNQAIGAPIYDVNGSAGGAVQSSSTSPC